MASRSIPTNWLNASLDFLPPQAHNSSRLPTYWQAGTNTKYHSRIDDILIAAPDLFKTRIIHAATIRTVTLPAVATDHSLLQASLPYQTLGVPDPPCLAHRNSTTVLRLPLKLEDKTALKLALAHQLAHKTAALKQELLHTLQRHITPNSTLNPASNDTTEPLAQLGDSTARDWVDQLGRKLTDLMSEALDIALQTCPTKNTNPDGVHYRPKRVQKARKAVLTDILQLKQIRQQINNGEQLPGEYTLTTPVWAMPSDTAQAHRACTHDGRQSLDNTIATLYRAKARIDARHHKLAYQQRAKQTNHLATTKQKLSNSIAMGKYKRPNKYTLSMVRDTTGEVVTNPAQVAHAVEQFYLAKATAPTHKTGRVLTDHTPRGYPWETRTNSDNFTLDTAASITRDTAKHNFTTLLPLIADKVEFMDCIRTLPGNKAPGPDVIPNELIQLMPADMHDSIHLAIQAFWITSLTPTSWKTSNTILLYKHKGDFTDLAQYRIIGLENTLYKLWTRMVQRAMVHHAETHGILTAGQAGFRPKQATHNQLEMLTMMLEDAQLYKRDLYLLQMDFSEAFDTIDQDKLLQVVYDLGYPMRAVEVVRDLYTNANTTFTLPSGENVTVPIQRGTIQGDSLSPFLFILYMEPLLRWLSVGARGYHPGCAHTASNKHKHQVHNVSYADDVNVLTGNVADLKVQASKISQ